MNVWIFGYGSLIWRPDFEFLRAAPATVSGWCRRFWQASHDHRGTPEQPGRVVTLIREANSLSGGMAYLVDEAIAVSTFSLLDHREKNGYERVNLKIQLADNKQGKTDAVTYIAAPNNFAYAGPQSTAEIAALIATRQGPSGSNRDYLFELAQALRDLDLVDEHVFELESAVRQINDS